MKSLITFIFALALLACGMELVAKERGNSAEANRPGTGPHQEPPSQSPQTEVPITSGTPFSWEDADKVQNGMTEAEVIAILGQPFSRRKSGSDAILIWSYTAGEASNAIAYRFLNGRVISNHRIRR